MKETMKLPADEIIQMYETMLHDLSYDLHERYSHLLTGLLHQMDQEGGSSKSALLLTHIIDDMRSKSNESTPLSLAKRGVVPAIRQFGKEIEHRFGVTVSLLTERESLSIDQRILFRLIQQTILMIVENADTDAIDIHMEEDSVTFRFLSPHEQIDVDEKGFLCLIQKRTGMELKIEQRSGQWFWIYFKKRGNKDDFHCDR
ncbi:hypothetical protein [Halobacillus aidingensis]|uniref:Two-component system, NarL family, sensor histidine kinase NreB n=1 Tax=Halobacillus aidingensis TaxID=240303 RepID=A0A1H0UWR6_HALAD|nr:hypothetical protein [Halobacillus aidingensis]SDP70505.1 two-component system, NarL family, sensor histidine kinase NreB [Halobacillus aidingensis]